MGQADELPFGFHLAESAYGELAEATGLFDLPEHGFDLRAFQNLTAAGRESPEIAWVAIAAGFRGLTSPAPRKVLKCAPG